MQAPEPIIIILAAGASQRFGSPKALISWQNMPLVTYLWQEARALSSKVLIISGKDDEAIRKVAPNEAAIIFNKDWMEGMASGIRLAVEECQKQWDAQAIMFLAIDQPFVNRKVLGEMWGDFSRSHHSPLCSQYADTFGIPAIFPNNYFDKLLELKGDKGAKSILSKESIHLYPFEKAAIDIDTRQDWENLLGLN